MLLKPSSDKTSQVILHGRPIGNKDAYQYFRTVGRGELRGEVHAAFDRLASRYNPIVLEGAGSISELNLQDSDIVNMPMAAYAGARVSLSPTSIVEESLPQSMARSCCRSLSGGS